MAMGSAQSRSILLGAGAGVGVGGDSHEPALIHPRRASASPSHPTPARPRAPTGRSLARTFLIGCASWVLMCAAAGCSSSSSGCTDMGCLDGVGVRFSSPADASLELSISLQMDNETVQCEYAEGNGLNSCTGQQVGVRVEGARVVGLDIVGHHPEELTITVSNAGDVLMSAAVRPTYVTQQPNGAGCPPTCVHAVAEL